MSNPVQALLTGLKAIANDDWDMADAAAAELKVKDWVPAAKNATWIEQLAWGALDRYEALREKTDE